MAIDYELEIDKLLNDGSHYIRSLARELLELKLEKIPILQEEIRNLKAERTHASSDWEEKSAVYTDSEYESTTEGSSAAIQSELFWYPFHWFADDLDLPADLPSDPPSPIPFLPADIVHVIFEHLLPNMDVVDFSTQGRLPWCRVAQTKTSIARVCRAWHSVALGFLYRDVVLHYVSQIIDFARTVSENPVTFGGRVRRLVFASRCLLPNGLSDDVHDAITTVLVNCPTVSRISFGGFADMNWPEREAEVILSRRGPPSAIPETDDQFRFPFSSSWILHIPSVAFRYLRSLEVALWSESAKHHEDFIHFPVLDTLILRIPVMPVGHRSSPSESLHYPVSWIMPSFRHLRFRWSQVELAATPSCFQFFNKYGSGLRSLGFGQQTSWVGHDDALGLMFLMKQCPDLDHLAIEPGLEALRRPPGGQTVRHVDLIVPDCLSETWAERVAKETMVLGWTSVRFFEISMIAILPDLPFYPLLPRTWAEFEAMHLKSPLDIFGYQVHVRALRREGAEVPDLVFYEAEWN